MIKYNGAEIYLTRCTHPDYSHLRYLGLDTKKDPDYLGSSVVLKWFINHLGRQHFSKEILDTVTGGMDACCKIEQEYILEYDAVSDPNFLNMNGGRQKMGNKNLEISLEFLVIPLSLVSRKFVSEINKEVKDIIQYYDQSRNQMVSRVISLLVYGYLNYEQLDFEYNQYCDYGSCTSKDVQAVLNCLARLGYIDVTYELITITPKLTEMIPLMVEPSHFKANLRGS